MRLHDPLGVHPSMTILCESLRFSACLWLSVVSYALHMLDFREKGPIRDCLRFVLSNSLHVLEASSLNFCQTSSAISENTSEPHPKSWRKLREKRFPAGSPAARWWGVPKSVYKRIFSKKTVKSQFSSHLHIAQACAPQQKENLLQT